MMLMMYMFFPLVGCNSLHHIDLIDITVQQVALYELRCRLINHRH